ncbi:MAG: helix-turn-helix domain-containing protein [Anaerolineae bacterium]
MPTQLYQEYVPHPALAAYVQCYWSIAQSAQPLTNHVLPDGCIDVMFSVTAGACFADVVGTMLSAASVPLEPATTFLGVRFKPGGALPFLRVSAQTLTDGVLRLDDVWPSVTRDLSEQIHDAPTLAAKVARLEAELLRRVLAIPAVDVLTLNTIHYIRAARGRVSVRELSTHAALSERQLERRFREHTGLSPKLFARLIRFRSAAMLLQQQPQLAVQDLVFASGFYDQAHFIHDFKAFAGVTPSEYQAQQRDVGFLQYRLRLP